jgi:hypothetical protein
LPHGFDTVVQAGMMVFSPRYHREIMEKVYYQYEEKGGPEWHYEMRPLSFEFLKAGIVHWIDPRFNLLWLDHVFLYYPFLLNPPKSRTVFQRAFRKGERLAGSSPAIDLRVACITTAFLNSYFLHFGGSELNDMKLLNTHTKSWLECRV